MCKPCKPTFLSTKVSSAGSDWDKKAVMLSSVEAWWVGLCALPFDGAQGDSSFCPLRVFRRGP